ncbi:MAG TPA: ABC transporter substrate-binding protein [Desulfuromonadaceae bacterium]|nr:ABC transporter substrate-binding protein [Desulfuromonadaceae bacterium]
MKRNVFLIAFASAATLCLSGCGKKTETTSAPANYPLPEPPLVSDCEPGIPGGRIVLVSYGDPKTFNPITANEQSSEEIYRHLFASMLGFDVPSQKVEPGLADTWTDSPDGKTWTFHLRKNLRWSDGEPLTADDVVFTCNDLIYNTNFNPVIADALRVEGKDYQVTKIDDLTVQVTTPEVVAPFVMNFGAGVPIMPKHVLAKTVADKTFLSAYGVNWSPKDIVCSGPFRIREYKPAQYIFLERNPYFMEVDKKGQRLPYFDNVVYTMVPDFNAMSLRFLAGESDADDFIFPYEYDRFKAEAAKGRFHLLEPGIGLETAFFWFNQNTNMNPKTGKPLVDPAKLKWFRNTKFRQAMSYAVDRDAIMRSVYSGRAVPNYGYVTPGDKKWYNPNTRQYPHDPDKARALLKEIGMEDRDGDGVIEDADGHKVEFVLNTNVGNGAREKSAVLIKADLEKIGVKVIFQPVEFNTLVQKIDDTEDYECVLLGLGGGGADPSAHSNVLKSNGFTHQWFRREKTPATDWEARIDQLMNEQDRTLDESARKKMFDEVQEILSEQVPMIFTVTPFYYCALRSDIGNARPSPLSAYRATWNIEELYFKK